jgi:hypothetical protein
MNTVDSNVACPIMKELRRLVRNTSLRRHERLLKPGTYLASIQDTAESDSPALSDRLHKGTRQGSISGDIKPVESSLETPTGLWYFCKLVVLVLRSQFLLVMPLPGWQPDSQDLIQGGVEEGGRCLASHDNGRGGVAGRGAERGSICALFNAVQL